MVTYYIKSNYAGALCYADDLALLAPSPSALRSMLRCCEDFANKRGLRFKAFKTQLIRFSSFSSSSCSSSFYLCGQQLPFLDTVTHLGHLVHYNLSDTPDIDDKMRSMIRKANCLFASLPLCLFASLPLCLFASFPRVGSPVLSRLFQSYCLSLYGSSIWSLSSSSLHNLEIAFNKILRQIWRLPNRSHTGIVHLVAKLDSLFNVTFRRSNSLLRAASECPSVLVQTVFRHASSACFSFCGYNSMFGHRHLKGYDSQYETCAAVIRAFRCLPYNNHDNEEMIRTISCD